MMTSTNMQIPSTESTMSTYWHEDWRVGVEKCGFAHMQHENKHLS
jgi:hypothetical protein